MQRFHENFRRIRNIFGPAESSAPAGLCTNLLLPIGSLVYLLFCVSKWGWGFDKYLAEANTGSGLKMSARLKPYFQFILPVLILFILIQGLI